MGGERSAADEDLLRTKKERPYHGSTGFLRKVGKADPSRAKARS
jgi:hypothetical protein